MATYNKFQQFVEDLAHGVHDLGSDTLKVMLTNTVPTATMETASEITEISAGSGYTAGGTGATISSSGHTTGTYKLVLADVEFTADSGTIGPFRYAVLYNDTPTSPADPLIGWWDHGEAVTLLDTQVFRWDANPTTGVLTLA